MTRDGTISDNTPQLGYLDASSAAEWRAYFAAGETFAVPLDRDAVNRRMRANTTVMVVASAVIVLSLGAGTVIALGAWGRALTFVLLFVLAAVTNFFVDANGNAVDITRADFSYEEIVNGNLRMPRGNEAGANEAWIPGGYLPEGIPEAVLNTHPDAGRGDPSAGGTWGSYTPFRL